jgi:hypothetical protein
VSKPQRYRFLDLYRGLIVFLMLEGHALRAVLEEEAREGVWFVVHELVHGITGPGFLFGAGFAFAIATQRRWEDALRLGLPFWRRLWRSVLIVLIGYALHLPFFSLVKTISETTPEQWNAFLAFDALQCIGIALIMLRFLLLVLRDERLFTRAVLILLVLCVYVTPFLWNEEVSHQLPKWLAQAVNGLNGSFFPLFPNAGYLFAGTLISWRFLRRAQEGEEQIFMRNLGISGILLILLGYLLDLVPVSVYPEYDFWFTSPNYFWMKLGTLMLLLVGLWEFENAVRHREDRDIWMPRWLIVMGIESFVVYIVHLLLLYGWVLNPTQNLTVLWGLKLNLLETLFVTAGFLGLMALLARAWNYVKNQHPVVMQGVYWYLGILFVYYFVTNPW